MADLIPPDYERCQALRLPGSFMTLGPRKWERCSKAPDFIAVEVVPGDDGLCGSMSLCLACAERMMKHEDLRKRIQLQPIIGPEDKL